MGNWKSPGPLLSRIHWGAIPRSGPFLRLKSGPFLKQVPYTIVSSVKNMVAVPTGNGDILLQPWIVKTLV